MTKRSVCTADRPADRPAVDTMSRSGVTLRWIMHLVDRRMSETMGIDVTLRAESIGGTPGFWGGHHTHHLKIDPSTKAL